MLWKCCARRPVGFKLKTHLVWGLGEDHVLAYLVLSSQRRRENVFNSHLHILKGRPEQWSQLLHHHIHLHLHLHESQLINILYKGDMKHIVKKKASNTPPPTTPAAWQWLQGMSRCAADQTGATSRPLHPRTSIWFKKAATASRYMLPAFPVMGRSKLIEDRVTSTLLTHLQDSITSSAKNKNSRFIPWVLQMVRYKIMIVFVW